MDLQYTNVDNTGIVHNGKSIASKTLLNQLEKIMLQAGQKAPGFTSVNQRTRIIGLSDLLAHQYVVLYFYPKDDTPGCTVEARDFSQLVEQFRQHDAVVVGVSKDDCSSHTAFIDKFDLKIDLLADTSGEICEAYGVWQEKEKNGVRKMGIVRSTFIIDQSGNIVEAMYGVNPEGHAKAVLEIIRQLG